MTDDPVLRGYLCREYNNTRVVNIRTGALYDVYIGRGGPFGNPFHLRTGASRDGPLIAYREYILQRPDLLRRLQELEGKILGCFCDPLDCHGHVIVGLIRDCYHL